MLDASSPPSFSASPPIAPVRLEYLDGLRGLAALYVVLHHALLEIDFHHDGAGLPRILVHATSGLLYGQIGVDIFIVLSGYCLMLPVARSESGHLRGGIRDFFVRRARRILRPYFAVLGACLLALGMVPAVSHAASIRWPGSQNPFAPLNLVSHLLLIHNWNTHQVYAIDYPLWSVASEWQIYFLFPLILLPLWRRFGSLAPVGAGFAFGLACFHWLPQTRLACPHFVGLFALGMAAATVSFSSAAHALRRRNRLPWGIFAATSALAACVLLTREAFLHPLFGVVTDALIGAATACFLVCATRHLTDPGHFAPPLGLRLCGASLSVWLGTSSYSLYLAHAPLLAIVHDIGARFRLPPSEMLLALFGIGVPLSVAVGYLFYRGFERPFMPGHPRTDKQAAQAAVVSPAP